MLPTDEFSSIIKYIDEEFKNYNLYKFKKDETKSAVYYSWLPRNAVDVSYINISNYEYYVSIQFSGYEVVSSESLADPSKNYQTTSAKMVKRKKVSINKEASNTKECIKYIDFIFNKISERFLESYKEKIMKLCESNTDKIADKCANEIINYASILSQKYAKRLGFEDESDDMMDFQIQVYELLAQEFEMYL